MTLDKIVESCRYLLESYPGARPSKSYLDSRLNKTSQEIFGFGYFPGIQDIAVLTDLVGEEMLRKQELLFTRTIEDALFPRKVLSSYFESHPLILPYRNTYGQVVALVGRSLLNDEDRSKLNIHKYKNTQDSPIFKKGQLLFGLYENKQYILDQDCVYIVEGQFDVIKASEIGFRNIVALGTSSMSPYQFSVISRYSNNIFLLLDNDESGNKGRKRISQQFGKHANIRDFYLPDAFKDIDECITKGKFGSFDEIPFGVRG